jgi:hypothetical protein
MQPLRFIPQANSRIRTDAAHFYFGPTRLDFRKPRKSGKPRIAPMNLPREDHCTPEKFRILFPDEVRWKNLLRHLEFRCLPEANSCPAFHMLELAKGFEPPTLGLQNRCSTD